MPYRSVVVPESLDGVRADRGVAQLTGLTRTKVAGAMASGAVNQNGHTLRKSDALTSGALLEISWEDTAPVTVEAKDVPDLAIVYEDADLVVVDKPVGIVAHPALSWHGETVLGALKARGVQVTTSGPAERQGIVQRLDVGTSGLMMVAKSDLAYSRLKQMFRDHVVHKTYHAIVQGLPDPVEGTIDAPIGRHTRRDWKFAVRPDGKPSVTHYVLEEALPFASLMEIELETGRTHQIRVHFAYVRHPLVGDVLYGADPTLARRLELARPALHAMRLRFEHPVTGKSMEFETPYPDDFTRALELLDPYHEEA